jgi:hypothetical protein
MTLVKCILLSLSVLIAFAAQVDRVELISCQQDQYDQTTKICIAGTDYRSQEPELEKLISYMDVYDIYDSCDGEHFCNISVTNQINGDKDIKGMCTVKKANGEPCVEQNECASTHCIPLNKTDKACSDNLVKENGLCSTNRDCESAYACSLTSRKCLKRVEEGQDCSDVSCVKSYMCDYLSSKCLKLFSIENYLSSSSSLFCKTGHLYPNSTCRPFEAMPTLDVNSKQSYQTCTTDNDCVYRYSNGEIADTEEDRCFYASWGEKEVQYCRFGGGETKLVESMKDLIKVFDVGSEFEQIAQSILSNPIQRLDLINPGNCTLYGEIKDKFGNGSMWVLSCMLVFLLLIV